MTGNPYDKRSPFNIRWVAGSLCGVALASLVAYRAGRSSAVDSAVAAQIRQERDQADLTYQTTLGNVQANQDKLNRLDDFDKKVGSLQLAVSTNQSALAEVNSSLHEKRSELNTLTAQVDKAKRQPVRLPAGHFHVGTDFPAGRYTATGSSNFSVHSSDGELRVSTILGKDFGNAEYVCELSDGDEVDTESAAALYPWR